MRVVLSITVALVGVIACLQVIPERATLVYCNEKYIVNASVYIKRYRRNSPYYINIQGRNKHTWDNNVTIHLIFYEYLHNEYRRSFVEMHFKFCDMLKSDPYVGAMVAKAGITCPLYPNMQYMVNMSIPAADFKYTCPFKKAMAQVYFTITATGEMIAKGNFYITFADKKRHI